ncbi:hypothetical protein RDI58_008118 [Solanum bulbocastanum]|uniref:Uncharacterized protein n=1 Tax=Solanum bulbocastanum TaxID=147425 RepID=A0AAN8YJ96_SOLBU
MVETCISIALIFMILNCTEDQSVTSVSTIYATVDQVLFRHSLKDTEDQSVTSLDHRITVEPMQITNPSTDSEISLALKSSGRLYLIHCEINVLAHEYKAILVLLNIPSTWVILGVWDKELAWMP